MEIKNFCQSCSMPLTNAGILGTERNGSPSHEYCKYCYREGLFTNPDITLDEMRQRVIDKLEEQKVPADIIETAVSRLPLLKRWKNEVKLL